MPLASIEFLSENFRLARDAANYSAECWIMPLVEYSSSTSQLTLSDTIVLSECLSVLLDCKQAEI